MYQKILLVIIFILLAVMQVSLFPNLLPYQITPDLVLIVIIIWVAKQGLKKVWLWSIIAGFILDIFTFRLIGINILALFIIACGVGSLAKRFLTAQKTTAFLVILGFVEVGTIVNFFLLNIFTLKNSFFSLNNFLESLFNPTILAWKLLYNAGLFIIIFWLINKIEKTFHLNSGKLLIK